MRIFVDDNDNGIFVQEFFTGSPIPSLKTFLGTPPIYRLIDGLPQGAVLEGQAAPY